MEKKRVSLVRVWLIALALWGVVVGLAACSSSSSSSTADGAALLSARCGSCHTLTVVTTTRQSQAEWDRTVTKMIRRGVSLTDAEKTTLVDYLAKTYGP